MKLIGVDVGATKIRSALIEGNKVKKSFVAKTKKNASKKIIVEQILSAIEKVFDKGVKGIGIGVPALVIKGKVFEGKNIKNLDKVDLKKIVEKKFKVEAKINNDAKCFALGELYFGEGKKFTNFAAVTLGSGVGTGIIINKQLYEGKNCGAGEYGRICFEGNETEEFCSAKFFEKKQTTGKIAFERAKKGNKKAKKLFDEFGKNLGKFLATIVDSINPEAIILGGSISESFNFFEKGMWKELKKNTYKKSVLGLKIIKSKNPNASVLGAANLSES
jgi:glucokinase